MPGTTVVPSLGHDGPRHSAPPKPRNRKAQFATLAIVIGFLALLGSGGWLLWSRQAGTAQAEGTVQALQEEWRDAPRPAETATAAAKTPKAEPAIPGKAFAIMTVPRFGKNWQMPIFEGIGSSSLRGGVGHYPNTAMPGSVGNFAVAGHRTTWARPFQKVDELRNGDEVIVQTREERFVYRVTSHQIVAPDETGVLDPVPGVPGGTPYQAQLTLTTCHPEYSDWQRWIVRAELVRS
ncbi:class E sortase [Kineosporia babensis]|uniref:Class E sortase n=1 Tax=Kineosporia babensis TaxID=499548 RepID=A0A9X1NKJ1_9ACTN|nr:class E sortase [Kineosporia babensis]MCD5314793.1 class E sortase [Kineosporia babensis]